MIKEANLQYIMVVDDSETDIYIAEKIIQIACPQVIVKHAETPNRGLKNNKRTRL